MRNPERSGGRRTLALALALPVATTVAFGVQLGAEVMTPGPDEWSEAVDALREGFEPGDGVLVAPTWAAAPWREIGGVIAAAGAAQSETLLHADPLTRADVSRYRRVWVLAPRADAPPPLLSAAELKLDAWPMRVYLAQVDVPAPRVDFLRALRDARVERVSAQGRAKVCAWDGELQRCDQRHWTAVRPMVEELGFTRRRALLTHAYPDKGVLRVAWSGVELGATLTGGVGLTHSSVRKLAGSDVSFQVHVGGELLWEVIMAPDDFAWHGFDLDTSRWTDGPADVAFEIRADSTYRRELGWDAVSF
jgi:hypothetical protein